MDLIDLSGNEIELYVHNIKQTLILDAEQNTGIKYIIKLIDTLSVARLFADDSVVTVINEAVVPNE